MIKDTSAPEPAPSWLARLRTSPRLHDPAWVLLPLRAFLGVTFVYAGVLKLTDSTYLDPSSANSVHAQMVRAAATSPIGPLVTLSAHASTVTGLLIAFGELAVGLGTLLGLWSRLSALGGLLLSLSFFLTVSWSTSPYFFGPDIVFFFAWMPLIVAGDGGLYSVSRAIRERVRSQVVVPSGRQLKPEVAAEIERRALLQTGAVAAGVGAVALVAGGGSALAAHNRATSTSAAQPTPTPVQPTPTGTASPSATASVAGTPVGSASSIAVGQAVQFTDGSSGNPAYAVQPTAGTYKAFSAICPHQGCTVDFSGGTFQCPCHGSQFDGATGAVLNGPAQSDLQPIPVKVVDGTLYAT